MFCVPIVGSSLPLDVLGVSSFPYKENLYVRDDTEVLLFLLTYISCKKSLFKVSPADLSPRGRPSCLRISRLHLAP